MRKLFGLSLVAAALAAAIGCSVPAHADQPGAAPPPGAQIAIGIAPAKVRAPYDVQVLRENGEALPTYAQKDRFYVQGNAGERYVIRVSNPTPNRVEAVVSVDGLDVVDGESGDLRKRGYIVPPYGDVRIEGFRTSQEDVATFRFSSVNDSYAGQKGKARNVGVIAVAIFEEQHEAPQQIVAPEPAAPPPPPGYRPPYDYTDDLDRGGAVSSRAPAKGAKDAKDARGADKARAESVARADRPAAKKAVSAAEASAAPAAPGRSAMRRPAPAPAPTGGAGGAPGASYDGDYSPPEDEAPAPAEHTNRPGLGTEFGEQRYSAASFTKFVRAGGRPVAIAELRYNDAAGLTALGIHLQALPDSNEIMTRETADPFPGDDRFARPPGR